MEARTKRLVISLTHTEKETLHSIAEYEGRLSLAATIRHIILEAARLRGIHKTGESISQKISTPGTKIG